MDFEGGSWDIAVDAENLHQSLFGNHYAHDHDTQKFKKGKKRKHSTVHVLDKTEHKKFKGDIDKPTDNANNRALETKQKNKNKKMKPKAVTSKHVGEESEIGNSLKTAKLHKSSDGLDRKNGKDSGDAISHLEDAGKKKKKRKRKCKKNKFKDYSKPDGTVNDLNIVNENTELKLDTMSNVSSLTESDKYNNKIKGAMKKAVSPDMYEDSKAATKQKKKKRKKMKTEKDIDSSTVENSVDETIVIMKDNKSTRFSNDMEFKVKEKKKKKHKSEIADSFSSKDIADIGHSDDHQLNGKGNAISQGKKSPKFGLDSKKKKKHRLNKENGSSFKDAIFSGGESNSVEHASQENMRTSHDKKGSSKHKRNQFDLEKLQAILKNKAQVKTGVGASNDVKSSSKSNNEHDKTKTKKDTEPVPESLLEKSRRKLSAARFRFLNEQLYTTTGSEAFQMFRKDKEAFQVYHDGFQGQVEKWPVNPLDLIIDDIKSKSKNMVVADFGCGDAKLVQSVPNKVHSFDLVALNHHVTVCDISKVPLKDSSVDIAVFCLSLMGTNLSSYLHQANRVLKKNGILKIAEVSSRFTSTGRFVLEVEKMGFKLVKQDNSNKMFLMMDFKKTGTAKLPAADIKLDPCVYKKR